MTEYRLYLAQLVGWLILGIPGFTIWRESLAWLNVMSWAALVGSSLAGLAAARAREEVQRLEAKEDRRSRSAGLRGTPIGDGPEDDPGQDDGAEEHPGQEDGR